MRIRGWGMLAFTLWAVGGVGCGSSTSGTAPSGSGGSTAGGGSGGGGNGGAGACDGFQTSAATPVAADAGAGPCTFEIPPPDVCSGGPVVRLDNGQSVFPDPVNGWSYTDNTQRTIQIMGQACGALTAGDAHAVCVEYECISDRNAKRDFAPVDRDAILQRLSRLPISTWRYRTDAQGTRHIGPMAQDFKLSFDVGTSDKTIFPIDESGVAFAAIQALNDRVDRLAEENARLKKEVAALRARKR